LIHLNRKNRPFIEDATEKILQRVDLLNIQAYYAHSTASGLWIPRLGDKIIGFIAIDASLDVKNDEQVTQ